MEIDFTTFLRTFKLAGNLYRARMEKAAASLGLSKQEADILLFFTNNPQYTSARDAVKVRGLSKAYVSKAVEMLLNKKLIEVSTNESDRRFQHIRLTADSKAVVQQLKNAQIAFFKAIHGDFDKEEEKIFNSFLSKLSDNIEKIAQSEEKNDKNI